MTRLLGRRTGAVGIALTAYDIWRRLPEKHRRRLLQETRKHGPRVAAAAVSKGRSRITGRRS